MNHGWGLCGALMMRGLYVFLLLVAPGAANSAVLPPGVDAYYYTGNAVNQPGSCYYTNALCQFSGGGRVTASVVLESVWKKGIHGRLAS